MRAVLLILIVGQLWGCAGRTGLDSEKVTYQPAPNVALTTFRSGEFVESVYVRHSAGSILIHLTSSENELEVSDSPLTLVLRLRPPGAFEFADTNYENFAESIDVFNDGRVVIVPLGKEDAIGVFVNLMSGRSYFLAPRPETMDERTQIEKLRDRRLGIRIITPEDRRAGELAALFPQFEE